VMEPQTPVADASVIPTYKYIGFREVEKKAKTSVWECFNKSAGSILGTLSWYGAWRQYCFFPEFDTVWSAGCLQDVIAFMNWLKEQRS
jgi:hypothetical protein